MISNIDTLDDGDYILHNPTGIPYKVYQCDGVRIIVEDEYSDLMTLNPEDVSRISKRKAEELMMNVTY